MQDSTLCPRQYLRAPLLCRGALCRVSHQPGKYGIKTKFKNKNRFNSRMLAAILLSRLEFHIIISCIDYDLLIVVIVWSACLM